MKFQTILFEKKESVGILWLNRPEILNAFNSLMLSEILECFKLIETFEDLVVIIIRGKGKAFCAGADLNWMRDVAKYSFQQNLEESLVVSDCFKAIYTCKKPVISVVHGAAIGGANGFIAPCTYAVAEENTKFSLSEVKIGIVPACISPYLLKRMGEFATRDLMLSGKRFTGKEAEKYRLINKSLPEKELEAFVNNLIIQTLRETKG
ncbi:MAG: enoyl-CoA hydratase/isomerase family protein [Bacteroidales bacterium]|nr:enoyl-CoA hydratase/isomerase family protein [Bacteroidales bacterium]